MTDGARVRIRVCRRFRLSGADTEEESVEQFEGRVAVVTGAASGMGLAFAERFVQEGMKVVLADVEEGALDRAVAQLTEAALGR